MATTTRDIVSRFIVTDNEILEQTKLIDASLQRMGKSLDQVGGEYDKLDREAKKTFDRQVRAQATFEAGGRQAEKLLKLLRELEQATNLDAEAEHRYALRILETRNALAEEMALARRNAAERQTRAGGGGRGAVPALGGGGGAGASDLERSAAAWRDVSTSGKSAIDTINKLSFSIFVLTFGTQQLGEVFLRTFVQVGERVEMQRQRIELLTGSTKTFAAVLGASMDVGVSLESFSASFTRLAVANQQMGLANDELVAMTKTITQLGIIGGGTAQEVAAGMQQLAQGFASGRLQGDELRSVMENLPYLAVKMSEKMGIAIGNFRDAGAAGEITGERMANAFRELKDEAEKLFNDLPVTSERGLQRIATQWDMMINGMLQAIGTGTVGDFFTGIADDLASVNTRMAENTATIQAWKLALTDVAAVLGSVAAAWFLVLRPIAGVISAVQAYRVAQAASVAATAEAVAVNAAYAAGMATAAAATEATAAATVAATAAVKAMQRAFLPLLAIVAVGELAWGAFGNAQTKVAESAEDIIDTIEKMGDKLNALTRRQLADMRTLAQVAMNNARDVMIESQKAADYRGFTFFTQTDEDYAKRNRQADKDRENYERAAVAVQTVGDAQEAVANKTQTAVSAMASLSKEMKKVVEDSRDLDSKLAGLNDRLYQISTQGAEAGNRAADVNDILRDRNAAMENEAQLFAAKPSPTSENAGLLRSNLDLIQELTDKRLRELRLKEAITDQTKAETEAVKASTEAERERLRVLDAKITKLRTIVKGAEDAYAKGMAGLNEAVPEGAALTPGQSDAFATVAKFQAIAAKGQAELNKLLKEREALGGASTATEAADATQEYTDALDANKLALHENLQAEKALRSVQKFQAETASIRAGNLEGEARFAAERDAAIAALGESEIKSLEALNDRKLALQEKYVADVKALKQKEIDTLAQDISQTMMSAFTAMADSGDSFNDVLERLAKSFRDMVVQLTVIKPLAQGMATLINGAFGANDSADKSSWISSFLGGMVKAAFADGGVVSAGLPHGVYTSPTVFPMASPGHRAFASGTGLLGEAGPEAVLPLRRGPSGQLGVQGGAAAVNVVVNTLPGQTANTSTDGNTITIDIIEQAMAARIARGGSSLPKAMEASYAGMRRAGR